MLLLGLTGNIACGKSTVLAALRERGAVTIDADAVTHQLQRPGEPVYAAIVAAFGPSILAEPGGPIDRRTLGAIVFADAAALHRLEQIVHPAVHDSIAAWIDAQRLAGARVAVIDAVKLLEAGWKAQCDAVWVVTCPPEQQLSRLMATRGLSEADASARIAAQPSQRSRAALADLVIDNGGPLDATLAQVDAGWWRLVGD